MVIPTPLSYKLNLTLSQEIFQKFFTLRFEEVCLVIETLHRYTIFIPMERQGCCMKKRCLQAIVTLTGALFLFLTGQWQQGNGNRAMARILSPVHRIWGFSLEIEAATHCATRHISHNRSRRMEQLPLGTQWQNYFASKPFGHFSSALTICCSVLNAFSPMFRYL